MTSLPARSGTCRAGEAVFTSLDGRNLYIARNSHVLLELPADGSGRAVVLRAPAGWHMSGITSGWAPTVAAGGIIVYSSGNQDYVPPEREGRPLESGDRPACGSSARA